MTEKASNKIQGRKSPSQLSLTDERKVEMSYLMIEEMMKSAEMATHRKRKKAKTRGQ